jgi:hypothetical protein
MTAVYRGAARSLAGVLPNGEGCALARRYGTDDWHEHDHAECQDVNDAEDQGDDGDGSRR